MISRYTEIHSTPNEGKSIVSERVIRILKNIIEQSKWSLLTLRQVYWLSSWK